jgi:flagellar biosynthesis anti-sigma factor FlgM
VNAMRVDSTNFGTGPVDGGKSERARPAPAASEHVNEAVKSSDTHFSFSQTRVRALTQEVLAQPEVRQVRVDLLRQSLGKGEYSVSDTQIADAIIADIASGNASQPAG